MDTSELNGKSHDVGILTSVSEEDFCQFHYHARKPVILRGLNIGPCKATWTAEYLKRKVGDVTVKVHVTTNPVMSFITKNFVYRSLRFDDLLDRVAKSEKKENYFFTQTELYYLRSLGNDARNDPADIKKQFPSLADDIHFPHLFQEDQFFSSVFRISSPGVRLWTHYDIMDNALIQVTGRKEVVLFPPTDVPYLYLKGDKSEVQDINSPDYEIYPEFQKVTRYTCTLIPGDILFIPALWFHNVVSLSTSIGVNVFWRHLNPNLYVKNDPYGNKDLIGAAEAFKFTEKALNSIDSLPEPYRKFYLQRIIKMCQNKIES